jgi:hypothetical protein
MDYVLKSNQYNEEHNAIFKIKHSYNEKFLTLFIQHGIESDIKNFESLGIVLDSKELHSLIGALLHIQSKMKGNNNG